MRYPLIFCIISNLSAMLLTQRASSQHLVSDTVNIESVSVFRNRTDNLTKAGLKSITIDTLILKGKKGLSLAELLQENSPIFIKTYGRGATATASFRGTGASHTNVYWNGLKVNSPMTGQADFSIIPLYFVDDVAILFGQTSMRYGSGGLGGSVNLQSFPDWGKPLAASVYQTVGSYQSYSTAAISSYGKGTFRAQTRIFRESSENNFSFRNIAKIDKPIEIQRNADYQKYGILQEVYFRSSDNSILSAKVWAQQKDSGIHPLMTNYSRAEIYRHNDINFNSIVEFSNSNDSVSWKVVSGVSFLNLYYDYSKFSVEGNPLPVLRTKSSSWSWSNRAILDWNPVSWFSSSFQGEVTGHWVKSYEAILGSGYTGNQLHSALRVMLVATPTDNLTVTSLFAQEFYSNKMMPLTYSFTIKYRLFKNNDVFANGGYSRNFNNPSLNDLFWQPGGNPNLLPEDAKSWEGGIQYLWQCSKFKLDVSANVFTSNINNWIMWLPHLKGFWEPVNLTQVKTIGGEVSVLAQYRVGELTLKFRGNYSKTQSSIENAGGVLRPEVHGKQIPFIPVHSGGVIANIIWKQIRAVYSFTHFSERFTTTSNNPNSMRRLYPYYMSSVAIGWDFSLYNQPIGVQLRIDNLLNESYQTILWRPMPGRNYSIALKVDL
ncbi:MAG: TonB-dependent receptor [Candidatus Moranbacteria bacterium]|jgi:iron complex outermembrane receptor protein|nr:TonB-dependent receptor [Candidatus Moranbacteria bacterium]